MIRTITLLCTAAFLSGSLAGIAAGQDAGLYENAIDPTKAYVRIMATGSEQASVGGSPLTLSEDHVSGYVSIPPGSVSIGSGEIAVEMTVEAGTYYTMALDGQGFLQFVDPPISDPSKSEVLFYNLSDQADVDLFVPAGKTNALSGIDAGTSESVELRAPLTLTFQAQAEGTVLASAADVKLERKQAVSLFLIETASGIELVHVVNSFAAVR